MTVGTVKTLSKSICIKNEFLKSINQAAVAVTDEITKQQM